ncbi:hypothetical protein MB27_11515 [Actinoplanes utahensis]|uniref:Uncharacterized protein n=1 Tax=Actinoplanes utahensis TaxID=1869 RepID=A0A0A6UMM9_ACTUT|nr:hypothetical protein MB27_11515 [Actinoplanes utahensis]
MPGVETSDTGIGMFERGGLPDVVGDRLLEQCTYGQGREQAEVSVDTKADVRHGVRHLLLE